MDKKLSVLITVMVLLLLIVKPVLSQEYRQNPLDKRYYKLESILKNKYPEVKKDQFELTIFSHDKCGRCRKLLELIRKKEVPIIVYDLKITKYGNLMRNLCYKKAGTKSIRIQYPVVVVNNEVYFKIKNLVEFVNEIQKRYSATK